MWLTYDISKIQQISAVKLRPRPFKANHGPVLARSLWAIQLHGEVHQSFTKSSNSPIFPHACFTKTYIYNDLQVFIIYIIHIYIYIISIIYIYIIYLSAYIYPSLFWDVLCQKQTKNTAAFRLSLAPRRRWKGRRTEVAPVALGRRLQGSRPAVAGIRENLGKIWEKKHEKTARSIGFLIRFIILFVR